MKKVVCTVTNDLSYDQRMTRICTALADAGFNVELVGRKLPDSIPCIERPFRQTRLTCVFNKGKLFYIEYNIRLFFFLLFRSVHIISSVDLDTLLACTLVAKIRSCKLVFDAHEYFTEVPEVVNRGLVKRVWEMVAKACIPHVNAAYTVNQSLAGIFSETYNKEFHVVRNMPSGKFPEHMASQTARVVLYQGALNEGRGLSEAIAAMQQVNAELWIAGKGDLDDALRKQVNHLKLDEKVRFLGVVTPDELRQITTQASVGLNLLENSGKSYYFSLANKFFDYVHAGLPQVCAPFPEYENINRQFEVAILCECNTEKIADTLNNLLHDSALYERLRSSCLLAREQFNWDKESGKLPAIYGRL